MTAERQPVPRGKLEQESERLQAELAQLLAVASERRAKMAASDRPKQGGHAA